MSHIPQRHHHPVQLWQQLQPIQDTPESQLPEDQSQRNSFYHYDLPDLPTMFQQWLMAYKTWHYTAILTTKNGLRDAWFIKNRKSKSSKKWSQTICSKRLKRASQSDNETWKKCFQRLAYKMEFSLLYPGSVTGCRLWRLNLHSQLR